MNGNASSAFILPFRAVLLPHKKLLGVTCNLRWSARHDAVLGNIAPVTLSKPLEALQETAMLLLRPGQAMGLEFTLGLALASAGILCVQVLSGPALAQQALHPLIVGLHMLGSLVW